MSGFNTQVLDLVPNSLIVYRCKITLRTKYLNKTTPQNKERPLREYSNTAQVKGNYNTQVQLLNLNWKFCSVDRRFLKLTAMLSICNPNKKKLRHQMLLLDKVKSISSGRFPAAELFMARVGRDATWLSTNNVQMYRLQFVFFWPT